MSEIGGACGYSIHETEVDRYQKRHQLSTYSIAKREIMITQIVWVKNLVHLQEIARYFKWDGIVIWNLEYILCNCTNILFGEPWPLTVIA